MKNSILNRFGRKLNIPNNRILHAIVRRAQSLKYRMPTWTERMELAKRLGFAPRFILDGGAFKGVWTQEVARIFPGAKIVLVEPNSYVLENINKNISHIQPTPTVINAALGASKGKAKLNIWRDVESDTSASLLNHVASNAATVIEVDVETIDNISEQIAMVPDLVKLDLQGSELAALRGSTNVLEHAEFVFVEFGCLEAYIERTTPRDLMEIMYSNDYCLYDIVDCHYRPYDNALTGGDFFFVKNDSILRQYKGWD